MNASHSALARVSWAAVLVGATQLMATPPVAAQSQGLNSNIDELCQPFADLNKKGAASAAPGSPLGVAMQQELKITPAQYNALWSLMKLTPSRSCSIIY